MKKRIAIIISLIIGLTSFVMMGSYLHATTKEKAVENNDFYSLQDNCIYLNEVCADTNADGELVRENDGKKVGEYFDWVEIYNSGNTPVNLGSYYITDNVSEEPAKYNLPDFELAGKEYFTVYCGKTPGNAQNDEYFSGFAISKSSETVSLTDGTKELNSITVKNATTNMSFSRYPDGSDTVIETTATPGKANVKLIKAPVFSKASCFSKESFQLTIGSEQEDVNIYYTLDGSDPTVSSEKYAEPITITDASSNDNVYSARTDVSPYLTSGLGVSNDGFSVPQSKVDKGTIVKAICVDNEGKASDISSEVYFVGLSEDSEYQDIPIVALWASDDDLFGYENGIYVLGKKFDEYRKNGLYDFVWKWQANYSEEREISAELAFFDKVSSGATREHVGLEIKGSASRRFPQKSFNVSGNKKRFCLSNGGNEVKYKIKDSITSAMAEGLDLVYSKYEPCQVFLNGEYWGVYYLGDRLFSKKYYKSQYGIKGNDFAIIKSGELNEGTEEDLNDYNELVAFVSSKDMTKSDNYNAVKEKINIDSMVDYYCIETFIGNTDWPHKNWACWRAKETDNKWNYILFDTNIEEAFSNTWVDMMSQTFNNDKMFKYLYSNSEFRRQFMSRYLELTETQFAYDSTKEKLDNICDMGAKYIQSNFDRYMGGSNGSSGYNSQRQSIDSFLSKRASYAIDDIKQINNSKGYNEQFINTGAISISDSTYEYDGKEHKPTVTVNGLTEGTDFEVTYDSDCISSGEKNIVITGIGKYAGKVIRTYTISNSQQLKEGHVATFQCESHAAVTVYDTQNVAGTKHENVSAIVARNGETGEVQCDGDDQLNFSVVTDKGWEVKDVTVTPSENFNEIKSPEETGTTYRITEVTGPITVSITTVICDHDFVDGVCTKCQTKAYKATIICTDCSVTTYDTQDTTASGNQNASVSYARNDQTGAIDISGDGQINFKIVLDEGAEFKSIDVSPEENFKNLKTITDKETGAITSYRITKITGDITITARACKHNWGNWTTTKEAKCVETGTKERSCSKCQQKETETLPALEHAMTKTDAKAATCCESGNNEYWTCTKCSKVFKDSTGTTATTVSKETIAKKAHSMTKHEGVSATCLKEGQKTYWTCATDCCEGVYYLKSDGSTKTTDKDDLVIAKAKHVMTSHTGTDATCREEGQKDYWTCSASCCKGIYYLSSDGSEETTNASELVIAKKDHKMTKHDGTSATCVKEGQKDYWTCSASCCKGIYYLSLDGSEETTNASELVIAKKKHEMTEHKGTPATCLKEGEKDYWTCSAKCCDGVYYLKSDGSTKTTSESDLVIAKKNHTMTEHKAIQTTCVKEGNVEYWTCAASCCKGIYYLSSDGSEETTNANELVIAKKNHEMIEHKGTDATCVKEGEKDYWTCAASCCEGVYYLSSDGTIKTTRKDDLVIAKKNHDMTEHRGTDATCVKEGEKDYWTCSASCCNGVYYLSSDGTTKTTKKDDLVIAKKNHDMTEHKGTDATCVKEGQKDYWTCSAECCNGVYYLASDGSTKTTRASNLVIAKKNHDMTEHKGFSATCVKEGQKEYWTCSADCCEGVYYLSSDGSTKTSDADDLVITKASHKMTRHWGKSATCLKEGQKDYWTCSASCCNGIYYLSSDGSAKTTNASELVIAKKDHEMTKHDGTTATCVKEGQKDYWTCSASCCKGIYYLSSDGSTKTTSAGELVIAKKKHEMTEHKGTTATCTKEGRLDYWTCSASCCEGIYYLSADGTAETTNSGNLVIPQKAHSIRTVPLADGCSYKQCTSCKARDENSYSAPSYVKSLKISKGKKNFTVKWKKQSKANQKKFSGYQIQYSLQSNMADAKTVMAGKGSKSKKIKKLLSKKKYYVRIRTYTVNSYGTFYSDWTGKTVKTK